MTKYALIALVAVAGLSTAAMAQNDNIDVSGDAYMQTATVNVGDLNLKTSAGKVQLRARLRQAVRDVCASDAPCAYEAEQTTAAKARAMIAAASEDRLAENSVVLRGAR